MNYEGDPIERIEHGLAINELAEAAKSEETIRRAEAETKQARDAAMAASTDAERVRAVLAEENAELDQIRALTADSRFEWEIGVVTTQDKK